MKVRNRKRAQTWAGAAALAGIVAGGASAAPGVSVAAKADAPLARALAAPAAHGWTAVIVKTQSGLSAAQRARMTALGMDIRRTLPIIGSLAGRVPTRNLAKLAALPFVMRLSYDGAVQRSDEFTDDHSRATAAVQQSGLNGQGVIVAVMDSGVSRHATTSEAASSGPSASSPATAGSTTCVGTGPTSPASPPATARTRPGPASPTPTGASRPAPGWAASGCWTRRARGTPAPSSRAFSTPWP